MRLDPLALTGFQRVLLEMYPARHDVFLRFSGPIDRAEAVSAGAVEDPVLLDLLDKLGPDCGSVDEAAETVTIAADAVASQAVSLRGTPGVEWADQALLAGSLRTIAVKMWHVQVASGRPLAF